MRSKSNDRVSYAEGAWLDLIPELILLVKGEEAFNAQ